MDKMSRKSLTEKDRTNQDIKRQVYLIAETILGIAKGVEEALVNITAVRGVLSRITHKLNQQEFICEEEKALLSLTEQWLNEENIRTKQVNGHGIGQVNLSQISALGNSFLSAASTEQTSGSPICTPSINKRFSVGSTQTLNEGEELDWDGNGVELAESFHSAYSGATTRTAFSKNPYDLCTLTNLLDSDESGGNSGDDGVTKTSSYQGIYEEEMEFTLEVEEGFYSDSSSHAFDDDICDFSPQADSGVTHMDSHASTDRSISHPDEELAVVIDDVRTDSPLSLEVTTYNRDINTWDMYGTVNLEEDLISTASSTNNSNTSTPRLIRKHKPLSPSSVQDQKETPLDSVRRPVIEPIKDISLCTQSIKKSDNSIESDAHKVSIVTKSCSRADSTEKHHKKSKSAPPTSITSQISESSSILGEVDETISSCHYGRGDAITDHKTVTHSHPDIPSMSTSDAGSTSSSRASSKLSIGTSILADGYLKSSHSDLRDSLSLPESLRRNKYNPKSRKPVFV